MSTNENIYWGKVPGESGGRAALTWTESVNADHTKYQADVHIGDP